MSPEAYCIIYIAYYCRVMGCLLSMDEFKPNPRIPGQGPEIYNIFDILELDSYAINVLYSCFVEIDVDKGGTVVLPELYSFLNRERSAFYDACFAVFDDDNSGQIDFVEFVCCMWFLCTLPLGLVGGFAFAVCDVDESDSISSMYPY